jgi:sulfite exporter TauE/SafE
MDSLVLTALTVGVLGGIHCVAMCGGIVSAFTLKQIPMRTVLESPGLSAQLPFNAGRIVSYGVAGFLAGGVGGAGFAAASLLPLQTMLFVAANGLVILLGMHLAGMGSTVLHLERLGGRAWSLIRSFAAQIPEARTPVGRLAAGALWGWTPCGLVYSMLALALVSGSALRGAMVMLAFGLGTLPNLLAAGWIVRTLGYRLRSPRVRLIAGLAVAVFGIIGLMRVPGLAQHIREGILCLGV